MPLLMCPNDNASMQTVSRSGVEFDMCPSCRGVWLDRGELEKLMQGVRTEMGPGAASDLDRVPAAAANQHYDSAGRAEYGERGDYGERGEYGERHGQGRRRRGFDLFDIFD